MSAPTYVIREGLVRGEGRYVTPEHFSFGLTSSRSNAARFFSLGAASLGLDPKCARIVRVVVKPKPLVATAAHALGQLSGYRIGYLAALEEAERACSVVAEAKRQNFGTASSSMDAARDCVDAIAAIRGSK